MRPLAALAAGFVFGALAYSAISFWLFAYHPAALVVSALVAGLWFSLAFCALACANALGPVLGFIASACIWAACELGRSSGTLAFPYGTLPYALYLYRLPLQAASFVGTAGLSLIIAALNLALAHSIASALSAYTTKHAGYKHWPKSLPFVLWAAVVVGTVLIGPPSHDGSMHAYALTGSQSAIPAAEGRFRVALIQSNAANPQKGPLDYRAAFTKLAALSTLALTAQPNLLAWHETAIVPALAWHERYRPERDTYELVADVLAFLRTFPQPVLLGNGWSDPNDPGQRIRSNAAMLYQQGQATALYAKSRLVPFSEQDPLDGAWPGFARWLELRFGHFWTPGSGPRVVQAGQASLATPICFEDSFGPYWASFKQPDAFVVLTDDSWGKSIALQNQHLAMSVFRAAETASVVLRTSATGVTAAIAPNGAIIGRLAHFQPGVLIAEFPLGQATTSAYEAWGKAISPLLLIAGAIAAALAYAAAIRSRAKQKTISKRVSD